MTSVFHKMVCESWKKTLNHFSWRVRVNYRYKGGARRWLLALLPLLALAVRVQPGAALSKMAVAFVWDAIDFRFDSGEQRRQLQKRGVYTPGEAVAFDVDVDQVKERVFVTLPHLFGGSAVTLATVENLQERYNPRLRPYPNMKWHAGLSRCNGLTSVFRIQVDNCERLWVVDSGDDFQRGVFTAICPPQLLVFDLATDRLITRHRFPRNLVSRDRSLMLTVVTEQMGNKCSDDVYAYIADAGDFALFVYHMRTNRSWRVPSDFFYPDVGARDFSVAGTRFSKFVGVLGLALSPCLDAACDRHLFFHSFSGHREGRVRTSVLRNESLYAGGRDGARPYIGLIGRRSLQSAGQAMSEKGVLFFGQIGEYTVNCWNMRTPYHTGNMHIVEYDYERIRVPMGMKAIRYPNGEEELWSISNNVQDLFNFDFTPNNTYPLHVLYGNINKLINGTGCNIPSA